MRNSKWQNVFTCFELTQLQESTGLERHIPYVWTWWKNIFFSNNQRHYVCCKFSRSQPTGLCFYLL